MNTWITSDTHYSHKNLIRGVSNWEDKSKCRPFDTIEEHNQMLVDNINACAKEGDKLYLLGDVSFGGLSQLWNFIKQLHCTDIELVYGNHDLHILRDKTLPNVFRDTNWEFTENSEDAVDKVTAQELFSSVQHYKEIKHAGIRICAFHYPIGSWNKIGYGAINLFGHCHATYITRGRQLDVGIDNAYKLLGEHRPFHMEEAVNLVKDLDIVQVDHHDKNTQ